MPPRGRSCAVNEGRWQTNGHRNINVNAIAPGLWGRTTTKPAGLCGRTLCAAVNFVERIPAGRWGGTQDIAGAALFLGAPASDYGTCTSRSGWGHGWHDETQCSLTASQRCLSLVLGQLRRSDGAAVDQGLSHWTTSLSKSAKVWASTTLPSD